MSSADTPIADNGTLDRDETTTIRFRDVVAAEVTKIITHPATLLAVALALVVNLALGVVDAAGLVRLSVGDRLVPVSELGSVMFAPAYLFLILPVIAAGSEYASGQLRITLAAVPQRGRLAAAKLAALLGITTPAALVTLAPGRLTLTLADGRGFAGALADLGLWTLAYTLMALIAYALTGIIRSSVASLSLLVLIPILIATGILQWPLVVRFLPDQLALSMLSTPGYTVTELPPVIAAVMLTAWALAPSGMNFAMLVRRDS
ncbi:hypothetical protein B0O41_3001 [Propionibacteriaceae bacterium ES.041]|uniref:hypothetical protein n=1 Tax=Enemella evansiae TaxID=2016499 RepID=UPI000B972298|nr:hypothetical protein [Enemella evansiae]OYO01077.1 ABC transporter [Enemella evansiae]OYO19046.1 ABC transporter [Enemella evansiae]PFG68169.1 hypothetical protein B0O41_3001 [Propionibacteriaceae bacterium ES.041]